MTQDLQSRGSKQRVQFRQRCQRTYGLNTNGHSPAALFVRHPHRNRLKFLLEFDNHLLDLSSTTSLSNIQCSPSMEEMQRIMHGDETRIAGIIACRIKETRDGRLKGYQLD
jgi:hypothetical protein